MRGWVKNTNKEEIKRKEMLEIKEGRGSKKRVVPVGQSSLSPKPKQRAFVLE